MHYSSLWLSYCITHRAVHVLSDWILSPSWTSLVQRILEGEILFCFLKSREGHPTISIKSEYLTTTNLKDLVTSHDMFLRQYVHIIDVMCASPHLLWSLWSLFSLEIDKVLQRNPGLWHRQWHWPSLLEFAQWVKFKPSFRADFISKAISSRKVTAALN